MKWFSIGALTACIFIADNSIEKSIFLAAMLVVMGQPEKRHDR